jgi:alanine racemase
MDAKLSLGEPRLLISRDALLHNAGIVRKSLPPETRICAVVKADAYGHGVDLVVDALYNFSTESIECPAVDALAVATVDEAEMLPATTLQTIIFRPVENSFVGSQRSRIETAIRNNWVLTLCSSSAADDVARIAVSVGRRAAVQIMVDTGMTRSGVDVSGFAHLLNTITAHASLRLVGIGTHFSEAEKMESAFTAHQVERFCAATDGPIALMNGNGNSGSTGRGKIVRHAANSAGIFFHPRSHFDMVRPGLSLYGLDPTFAPSMDRPLRPAMKWTAPLIGVREVKLGTSVGYGQTWIAPRDTKIGLVPVGYADGYLRCFSNRASMIVEGKPAPVVGTVSMDSTTIDLGPASSAVIGDQVTVLDDNPLSPVSAYALARWAETIPYEIFCRIGPRVKRVAKEAELMEKRQ